MNEADPPADSEPPARGRETYEQSELAQRSAFLEHLRHGHRVERVPEDEAEAWRLHQKLHGR